MDQPRHEEIAKYKGQPYVRLVRVSDAGDKQASDEAQLSFLLNWANQRQMVFVRDYVENDLSGSLPGNRHDLRTVLKDAEEKQDFRWKGASKMPARGRGEGRGKCLH